VPEGVLPKHVAQLGMAETADLDIPPNSKNVRLDGYTTLTKPAVIPLFSRTCTIAARRNVST
jgi:hypothetical protein